MALEYITRIARSPTVKILQKHANFAISQLPKVALWGLPALVGGEWGNLEYDSFFPIKNPVLILGGWVAYPALAHHFK